MTLLLYAIASGDTSVPPGVTGLGGSALDTVVDGDLAAVVSACERPPEPCPETLMAYEQIVERLMDEGTILPARFGTALGDESGTVTLLKERREGFRAALARVSGAVELGVRAEWSEDPASPRQGPAAAMSAPAGSATATAGSSPGLAYMNERLERRRRAREIAAAIDARLRDLARERSCRILARSESPVAAAYLVGRSRVDEFFDRCEDLAESVAGATVVCTGPWPPYSFIEQEPS